MIWCVLIFIVILILAILFVPIKIVIDYSVEKQDLKTKPVNGNDYIDIYILYFLKIYRLQLNKIKEVDYSKATKKASEYKKSGFNPRNIKELLSKIYIEKINLNFDFNLKDPILNAYGIASLNAIINMYFGFHADNINFKNVAYSTNISNKLVKIKFESIIKFSIANTIGIIFKIILNLRKVEDKNGRSTTSNRKLNDDSDDIIREYG